MARRYIRHAILGVNVLVLVSVMFFVFHGTHSAARPQHAVSNTSSFGSQATGTDPLDQLSSADIAVNLARMTRIPEANEVTNQAISVSTELTLAPANATVVAKPLAVATALKSRKDIQSYVVQDGETVAAVATKFNVTSDSIRWSNGLTGDKVAAGTKVTIPPVSGIVYTVRGGDTPENLASKFKADKDQIVAYNDAEISGLHVGEQIIIPNGQQVVVVSSRGSYGLGYLGGIPTYGPNGYDPGFCTWYAANRRAQLGNPVPGNLGDAYTWAYRASAFGVPTGNEPRAGAVAVKHSGSPGHVSVVEVVNEDGSFWMSEMNSYGQKSMTDSTPTGGWSVRDYKLVSAGGASAYTFVY